MLKNEGEGNGASYVEHIGIFFFFIACSAVSIIVWVFNWICWINQCCCCDFLHNSVNKRLVWWTSFIFLCGILACCISGFVATNRFGFALEGSYCSFERLFYDSKFGQLKLTYPKWEGFKSLSDNLTLLKEFIDKEIPIGEISVTGLSNNIGSFSQFLVVFNGIVESDDCKKEKIIEEVYPIVFNYGKIFDSVNTLKNNYNNALFKDQLESLRIYFDDVLKDFETLKNDFINEFYYYARHAKGWGRILTTIYFSILLSVTTFACVSMMFYACLRRQGYLSTFMHVLWNIIRFFIFSFFFYGGAYGMCYLALRDAVAFVIFVFGEENLNGPKSYLIPTGNGKDYLKYCLLNGKNDYKNELREALTSSLEDFFTSYSELSTILKSKTYEYANKCNDLHWSSISDEIGTKFGNLCKGNICQDFPEIAIRKGGLFGSFDCSFLKSDLDMMKRTVYDLHVEARIICALSCCIGFFGAIAIYFFLLVLHHYNNELFYDSGQSNFKGFEGFGYKKLDGNKNPAYKKRKIRSEIELSSRNDQYSVN